jgi:hypothetical protein
MFGKIAMQKLCLHSLVRLLSSLEEGEDGVGDTFEKLANLRIVPLISSCLRSEDAELVSWSIFMLHEFAYRNVARDQVRQIKGLLKLLSPLLVKSDNVIPRIILRTLKSLCKTDKVHYDVKFKKSIIKAGVLQK